MATNVGAAMDTARYDGAELFAEAADRPVEELVEARSEWWGFCHWVHTIHVPTPRRRAFVRRERTLRFRRLPVKDGEERVTGRCRYRMHPEQRCSGRI